jgi:hypothetical protein
MTPPTLARALVAALQPSGVLLEPCAGTGNFARALEPYGTVVTCELVDGEDVLTWTRHVDWIVTNPPWSKFAKMLAHALDVADCVALVVTINHLWTRHRRELVRRAGFGLEAIIESAPAEWKPTGFQVGMVVLRRGYTGACTITTLPGEGTDR